MFTVEVMFTFNAFAGTSSGPTALPFFNIFRAYHISIGVYPLLVEISGGLSEGGRFSSSLKCSSHRVSCSSTSTVLKEVPCLSLIGFSSCWYLPDNFFVVAYSSLRFLNLAASCAGLAKSSANSSYRFLYFF